MDDKGEFSIYVKGIISPYAWLNIDIASEEAEKIRLVKIDPSKKIIIVDLSKNPPNIKSKQSKE